MTFTRFTMFGVLSNAIYLYEYHKDDIHKDETFSSLEELLNDIVKYIKSEVPEEERDEASWSIAMMLQDHNMQLVKKQVFGLFTFGGWELIAK